MSFVVPCDPESVAPLPLFDAARSPLLLNAAPLLPTTVCEAVNDRTNSSATDAKTMPASLLAERSGAAAEKMAVGIEDARSTLADIGHSIVLFDKSRAGAVVPPTPRGCATCGSGSGLRRTETHCPRCRLAARLAALLAGGELMPAAWERLRRTLCLPKKPPKFPPDKARAALKMLDSFVAAVPVAEQRVLTDTELLRRLIELPGLPSRFTKAGRGKTTKTGNKSVTDKAGGVAARGGNGAEKANAADAETVGAGRVPISAALFRTVAVRQGCYCYWCGVRVVRAAELPPHGRRLKNGRTIVHYVGDELREAACATVDHLVRVADGGDNRLENLVISCFACNQERARVAVAFGRPFVRQRAAACRTCGGDGRFFYPDWGGCSICGAVPERLEKFSSRRRGFGKLFSLIERLKNVVFRNRQSL